MIVAAVFSWTACAPVRELPGPVSGGLAKADGKEVRGLVAQPSKPVEQRRPATRAVRSVVDATPPVVRQPVSRTVAPARAPTPTARATPGPAARAPAPPPEQTMFVKPGATAREVSLYEEAIQLSKVRGSLKAVPGWTARDASKATLRKGAVTLRVGDHIDRASARAAAEAALRVPGVVRVEVVRE